MICGIIVLLFMTVPWIAVFGMCSRKGFLRPCESLVLAFAVAPVSVSYILWLLMMAFPGRLSSLQIFWIVAAIFLAGNVILFRQTTESFRRCRRELSDFIAVHQIGRRAVWGFGGMMFLAVVGLAIWVEINPMIYGFDVSEYMLGGDMFYKSRAIVYNGCFVDSQNGFWYHTYHSFLFPLFGTWGNILTEVLSVPKDWYFKFIMVFYWLVLNLYAMVLLGKHIKNRRDLVIAGCGLAFLDFVPVTFDFILFYGIDFFRVTFFTVTCVFLYRTLRKPTWNNVIFLGFFASFSMAAHGLQVLATTLLLPSLLFLFFRRDISRFGTKLAVLAGMICLLAGSHYLLMMFCGDGWLFGPDFLGQIGKDLSGHMGKDFSEAAAIARTPRMYWDIASLLGFSWLLLLVPEYDLLKTCSERGFSFAETAMIVCFLLLSVGLAYFAYFNFRYWYTLHPALIIGLWCMLWDRQVCRTPGRLLVLTGLQILITMCICGASLLRLLHGDHREASFPPNVTVGKAGLASDPKNPFDFIPKDSREVLVVSKNKRLLCDARFPVYYCGLNRQVMFLQLFTRADACHSAADFLPLLRKNHISFVIVEKNNLYPAQIAAVAELGKHSRVFFESKNYCIWTLDK